MSQSCLNCGAITQDKFCAHCGQKTNTKRISYHALLHDIPHTILHIDKGFFYTFAQLTKRPGPAIREYINGHRVSHYSPFAYLLLMCAASSLVSHLEASYLEHFKGVTISLSPYLFSARLAEFFSEYPALMFCLMVPVISLWSYLFNRQSGYNYTENLVLNIYLIAQFNIFIVLNYVVMFLAGKIGGNVTPLLSLFFLYTAFVYTRFFSKRGVAKTIMMYVALILTVITTLSVCGFMTPWWGVRS